ncbi:hypothetical protein [Ilumatobacter sp.]|uniref:hypothetical protein n=1 Tax=Ilumatobacter sp. TaxID=1967498 RepID=UPI003C3D1ED8
MRSTLVYLRAATSWGLLAGSVATMVGLLMVVARWPNALWPLHGGVIGIVAGMSAWAVDERCAAVVDVTSRPLWWRSTVRAVPPVVLAVTWLSIHVVIRDDLPDHLRLFVLQGIAASVLGFAIGCRLRQQGRAEPGHRFAGVASPLILGIALARPADEHAPLFPIWPHEDWARSRAIWVTLAFVGVAVLVRTFWIDSRAASRDPAARCLA